MSYRYPDSPQLPRTRWRGPALASLWLLLSASSAAAWDLSEVEITKLGNGLTLLVLEEQTRPLVSVQMLYRVGARDEQIGGTGLAHFLEHMAFRSSENFPDTEVVSAIYAVGGEWHGYTWLDQTTYFATVPAAHLDLLLRIEADRMAGLLIPEADVEAERGAVLAEMHGYENDPASVLKDAVLSVSFLQHPYRNNTIGWESDVRSIDHRDLVDFYRRHYRPSNAVLAVVGNVSGREVAARVRELFGTLPEARPTKAPPTVEPRQVGLRRVDLQGSGGRSRFEIAYRAPAVTAPDYAAFLLLRQVLAGGTGVNFAQDEWGDPPRPGSRLDGITDDLVTWYPPTAFPYVFSIAGSVEAAAPAGELEARLERAIATARDSPPTEAELGRARRQLLDELIFDVETTEDAAHQLAYFEGLGGLQVLLDLPRRVAAVTADEVHRVAMSYLGPKQRTIGWHRTGTSPETRPVQPAGVTGRPDWPAAETRPKGAAEEISPPRLLRLASGMPVLFQRQPLTPTAYLRILLPTTRLQIPGTAVRHDPVWRHTSLNLRIRPHELEAALQRARTALRAAALEPPPSASQIEDPARRLAQTLDELVGATSPPPLGGAAVIALVGDLSEADALAALEQAFGDLEPRHATFADLELASAQRRADGGAGAVQAQLGYVVPAPAPDDPDALAWRILLYVLSHGYEGRLGKEAISRRGLVYYIDARYMTDSVNGRVSLTIGVDPPKLDAMRQLLDETLENLGRHPPTKTEIAEAKRHLLGRRISRAQSNEEVSAALVEEWTGYGRLLPDAEFAAAVEAVAREDLIRILPEFLSGAIAVVGVGD